MIKFVVLGSGSKGNSTYIDVDGRRLLIDCGFTKIATKKRLAIIGKTIEDIGGIYVTHYHKDHCSPWILKDNMLRNDVDEPFISSFPLSHDSECLGYIVQDTAGNKLALLTDTGCIPDEIIPHLLNCNAILIETSYSIEMLIDSPYPTELQERIASHTGHLRDECAFDVLKTVAWPGLQYVVAMHLSSTCINPDLLNFELKSIAQKSMPGCEVIITEQKKPTKMITLI
jgi:phosphoribosyl 1,2-cyclic phosphodiesterase